jgi:hypothetical protein
MRPKPLLATAIAATGLMLALGCGQTQYPDALPATLEEVERVVDDDSLDPEEKREQLAVLLEIEDASDPDSADAVLLNALLQDERLANQFGGNLSSAYDKVVGDQLSEMTPDEVQYYGDATDQVTLSDSEAQAIADLFGAERIDSLTDLEEFLDDPASELPDEIDEEDLRSVFIETSPNYVRDKL